MLNKQKRKIKVLLLSIRKEVLVWLQDAGQSMQVWVSWGQMPKHHQL